MKLVSIFILVAVIVVGNGCVSVLRHRDRNEEPRQKNIAGSGYNMPLIIIHKYDYEAKPPALTPGTPPLPPSVSIPPPVAYKTSYESAWDDPTLVVFVNQSYRVVRIQIGDEPEIRLAPYQATANLHLAPGEYNIRKTVEKPVKLGQGAVFDWVTFFKLNVTLNGRSQIINLYDN